MGLRRLRWGAAAISVALLGIACSGSEDPLFAPINPDAAAGGHSGSAGGSGHGGYNTGGSNLGGESNQGGGGQGGSNEGGSNQGGAGQGGTSEGGSGGSTTGGSGGSTGCPYTDSTDHDNDGWSFTQGDCNDCSPLINPGALDGAGLGAAGTDDDCDGTPDNAVVECDSGLALDDADPISGAKAIGLCATTTASAVGKEKRWGVIAAKYVKADGTDGMNPLSHGLSPAFGAANPQQGASMLVLSSGTARAPAQPAYQAPSGADMKTECTAPPGFPKGSTICPSVSPASKFYDAAGLLLQIRVPTNAQSLSFRFNFYTFEFPDYVCAEFNDAFTALLTPAPAGAADGNLPFDSAGNPISANTDLLRVCAAQTAGNHAFACPTGIGLLASTGFEGHAATGWLSTFTPVTPGSVITLGFAIWDAGDHILDSTVLIDQLDWGPAIPAVHTDPVPNPK